MSRISTYLNSPYPLDIDWLPGIRKSFYFGVIITAILFVFKPFGFHNIKGWDALWYAMAFGGITMAIVILNSLIIPRLFPKVFDEDRWKLWKEFIYIIFTISSIGFANTLFLYYSELAGGKFLDMLYFIEINTFFVGTIPVAVFLILDQNRLYRQNFQNAIQMNAHLGDRRVSEESEYKIIDEKGKEYDSIILNDLVYIKSDGNYLDLFLLTEGAALNRITIRQRLKVILDDLPESKFYNCHKSFVVNLEHVNQISGNARNYVLELKVDEVEIPVSRSKGKELQEMLS